MKIVTRDVIIIIDEEKNKSYTYLWSKEIIILKVEYDHLTGINFNTTMSKKPNHDILASIHLTLPWCTLNNNY